MLYMELTQDLNKIYYVDPSNSNGMELVITLIDGSCYESVKRSMVIDLTVQNKLCFVDRIVLKSAIAATYNSFSRCNSMIIGRIISALEPQITSSLHSS